MPALIVKKVAIEVGRSRGNEIRVLKGLKAGDSVVTAGQIKLRNDAPVVIVSASKYDTHQATQAKAK